MPAALPADWQGLQLLFTQGATLEELSQTTGISLNTLKARSAREGWNRANQAKKEQKREMQLAVAVQNGQMQPHATEAVNTLDLLLKQDGDATKLAGMQYAKLVTQHAVTMAQEQPETALNHAANVKAALQSAAIAGRWDRDTGTTFNLAFFSLSGEQQEEQQAQIIDVDSEPGT